MDLTGITIVITGTSRGLGAGMAEWFLERGARVGGCARNRPTLPGDRAFNAAVDVTDPAALANFAALVGSRFGPIDMWVNNAAVLEPLAPVRRLAWESLEPHLQVNVGGVLNGIKAYLDHLAVHERQGALVNISSGAAQRGWAGVGAYCVAKAGVDRLTQTVAAEEPGLLRLALAVSPGVVETSMQETLRAQDGTVVADVDQFRRLHEEGVMNTPDWVAQHIAGWVFDTPPDESIVRVPSQHA